MSIPGRFGDTSGRPYVEGRLILPELRIEGEISWLVDTGADTTLLNPADGVRLGIDYSVLRGDRATLGMGGPMSSFVERAVLVFTEPGAALHAYELEMAISPPDPWLMRLPSLLGRDVIDRWRMVYDPTEGQLEFEVRSADVSVPL